MQNHEMKTKVIKSRVLHCQVCDLSIEGLTVTFVFLISIGCIDRLSRVPEYVVSVLQLPPPSPVLESNEYSPDFSSLLTLVVVVVVVVVVLPPTMASGIALSDDWVPYSSSVFDSVVVATTVTVSVVFVVGGVGLKGRRAGSVVLVGRIRDARIDERCRSFAFRRWATFDVLAT